eukprot:XP_017456246.1 PREDICTED: enhancer of filamentation 1-like [Rattus norvegicus]
MRTPRPYAEYAVLICPPQRLNLMARALYDNVPECAEELAFRKGDILTVIEQNTGGLEGWWLCSLHGRQGIVPGNRVKLLIGPVQEPSSHEQPTPGPMHQNFGQQKLYQVPNSQAAPRDTIYQVPLRRATHARAARPGNPAYSMEAHMVSSSIIFLKTCFIQGTVTALLLLYRQMRNSPDILKVRRFTERVKR